MDNTKYSYLKHIQRCEKFILPEDAILPSFLLDGSRGNFFAPVFQEEISEAEKLLGFEFPKALKEFWLEIGYGCLSVDVNGKDSDLDNYIMQPSMIANILLRKDESEDMLLPILPDILDEFLEEGDIPFMEVSDSSSFLNMKRGSEGIHYRGENLIEENFERLIWRMYHESAKYYLYMGPFSQI